jgi:hypothetical protein
MLQAWQISLLFVLNVLIYALISLRWWLIVRAEKRDVSFFPLLATRVAVFGVSYFTLGPQVGGQAASSVVFATQLWHDLHPRHIHSGDG